jgi:hypothetical protein
VPFHELGVATSNLTFFRQIGGTIALAIAETLFETGFNAQLVPKLTSARVPPQVVSGIQQASATGGFDLNQVAGVGLDLGKGIMAALPSQIQSTVTPFVSNIVNGIYGAFSTAVGQTFYIGIGAAIIAAVVAATMHEHPLRTTNGGPALAPAKESGGPGASALS